MGNLFSISIDLGSCCFNCMAWHASYANLDEKNLKELSSQLEKLLELRNDVKQVEL